MTAPSSFTPIDDYMSRVESRTYKIRAQDISEAIYVTVLVANGTIAGLFINSKNMASFPWISYTTTTIAERLKRGEDPKVIIKELKDTYDTSGGYPIPKSRGKRANSVLSHIGYVLEQCLKEIQNESSTSTSGS